MKQTILPVAAAPVYAITHLQVDNSQSFTDESLPDDNMYLKNKTKTIIQM